MELGCDPRGYSRAGQHTDTWYCAVIAGRHSPELGTMRGVSVFSVILVHYIALSLFSEEEFMIYICHLAFIFFKFSNWCE